jgi:hypothetical protein
MKIVIDSSSILKNSFSGEFFRYIIDAISYLKKEKPQVEFIFLIDKISIEKIPFSIPAANLSIKKSWPGLAGRKIWYQRQLPAILKKTNADILITTAIASKHVLIPQCIWIPGLLEENYLKKKYFSRITKKLPKTLEIVKIVFTNSEKNKKSLIAAYPSVHNKIILIPGAADQNAVPISWQEKENIKIQYTSGREYFLFYQPGLSFSAFVNLLKAFSQFKKRQQSNIQLVIAGMRKEKKILEKLEGFKYRADVHFHNDEVKINLENIFSAAYAILLPGANENILLNSFSMHVPVITDNEKYPHEMPTDAVLRAGFSDIEELAAQLMSLYKDESMRNELIAKGKIIAEKYSRHYQATQLWEGLTKGFS